MEKLFAGLAIIVVVLSLPCGFLLYQINEVKNQNSRIQDQIAQLENEKKEHENQMTELKNQRSDLRKQIANLEKQILQKKLSEASHVRITNVEVFI